MRFNRIVFLLAMANWALRAANLRGEIPGDGVTAAISTYEVKGALQSVDLAHHQAMIAHGEIPGYMPAMTMSFDVHDPSELQSLKPGDSLTFRLCVSASSDWIEQIRKTGEQTPLPPLPAGPAQTRELSVGDVLPDIELVDQAGHTVHLHDFRGQVLALTFIYARCPLPTYCPLMNRNFERAQSLLARLNGGDDWHLFSISLDASHDTPDVLPSFAAAYAADARHWSFVTAPEDRVRQFGRTVGLQFSVAGGQISHNLRTVVVDATGHVAQIYRGNSWTPQDLASDMLAAMRRRTDLTRR